MYNNMSPFCLTARQVCVSNHGGNKEEKIISPHFFFVVVVVVVMRDDDRGSGSRCWLAGHQPIARTHAHTHAHTTKLFFRRTCVTCVSFFVFFDILESGKVIRLR
jgi:hypothetical protein